MKTFRKENGGYALLYVMVVIVVVCAIVMAICTSAMENYKAQQDSVSLMEIKYAVMGEVEKKLAIVNMGYSVSKEETSAPESAYEEYLKNNIQIDKIDKVNNIDPVPENLYTFTIRESSKDMGISETNDVEVTVTVEVQVVISEDVNVNHYVVTPANIKIMTYDVAVHNGGAA